MSIILINRTRRVKVFELQHDAYCKKHGQCGCGPRGDEEGGSWVAPSIALLGGARSPELSEAVLDVPDVLRSMAAGEVGLEMVKGSGNRGQDTGE